MAADPRAMPLKEFIAEVMQILQTTPDVKEVLVERAKMLRFAEANGTYGDLFQSYNDAMSKGR